MEGLKEAVTDRQARRSVVVLSALNMMLSGELGISNYVGYY